MKTKTLTLLAMTALALGGPLSCSRGQQGAKHEAPPTATPAPVLRGGKAPAVEAAPDDPMGADESSALEPPEAGMEPPMAEEDGKPRRPTKKSAEGAGRVERVAPAGEFSEAAHQRFEELDEQIEVAEAAMATFYEDAQSSERWQAAHTAIRDCRVAAEEFAEEYQGFQGIDKHIASLREKEEKLNADKP